MPKALLKMQKADIMEEKEGMTDRCSFRMKDKDIKRECYYTNLILLIRGDKIKEKIESLEEKLSNYQ